MSAENVELVKTWFDRWNRGERFLGEELHPEVEIESRFQPEPYRGPEGFRRWTEEVDEQFQSWQIVIDEFRDSGGGEVVALGRVHLVGHESGVPYEQPLGWIVRVDDEKLRHLRIFRDQADALAAAGLSR
ncbi:MAG TPA: nuclear transport factor 2 family protein [Solirubrobacterales bacterium]